MLSRHQFDRIRRLALSLTGIELADRHRELLAHRCSRQGIGVSEELNEVLGAAEREEPAATQKLVRLLTTKVTGFFRHPGHFKKAADHIFHRVQQGHAVRVWSAGCATGQEPYSIALAVLEALGREAPPVSIVAADIDEQALAFARQGAYGESALKGLSDERRSRFFDPSNGSPSWTVRAEVRRTVEFVVVNLSAVSWAVEGPFDIVFCRNVLMYLEACYRYSAVERIASFLSPGGLLILDPTEHLGQASHWFAPEPHGVYSRRSELADLRRGRKMALAWKL
jgi:chemotaxis protein methyltransferase CheR